LREAKIATTPSNAASLPNVPRNYKTTIKTHQHILVHLKLRLQATLRKNAFRDIVYAAKPQNLDDLEWRVTKVDASILAEKVSSNISVRIYAHARLRRERCII
jgi:hypothetical protein